MSELNTSRGAVAASDFLSLSIRAGRVFTPNAPINEKELFSGRLEQVSTITDVVYQRGQHAILYGERGVGKTSLVNVLATFLGLPTILVPRVNCDSMDDYASVWRKVFDEISITRSRPGIGFTTETMTLIERGSSLLEEPVTPATVRRGLLHFGGTTCVIIIDEFDRLPEPVRRAFADTIKLLSDYSVEATVILVGVADSVDELFAEHQSIERALIQIQMPRMSRVEILEILNKGFDALGMSIAEPALKQISKLSQGLPHYAHLLALNAVRSCFGRASLRIEVADVKDAIEKSLSGANQTIRAAYETAVRSARKENLFSDVLLACALSETSDLGWFAAQDVREPMRLITGKRYEIPSFAQHLNEFCDERRGPILVKKGSPRLYRYRFINPLMQPFVIMKGIQQGIISTAMLE